MNPRISALLVALGLVVGYGAGWMLNRPSEAEGRAPLDAGPEPGAEADAAPPPALGSAEGLLDTARARLEEEVARREKAEGALADLKAHIATARAEGKGVPAGPAADVLKGAPYRVQAKYSKALDDVDWTAAGEALSKMNPLLVELAKTIQEGKPPPPSVGQIQRWNGPLVQVALTAQQGGVPGTGANGVFTHPAMIANLVFATLREAGKPLTEGQEARLKELADQFVAEDARREAGYDDTSIALQRLIEEAALRDRFYAEVDRLVTDEQRDVLHPEEVRGRVSFDLFSSGLLYATVLAPQRYATTEQLAMNVGSQIMSRFQVPPDHKAVVDDAVAEWVRSFPPGYLDEKADALSRGRRLKIDRVRLAAEKQLEMYRRIIESLPADAPAVAGIRATPAVAVPVRMP